MPKKFESPAFPTIINEFFFRYFQMKILQEEMLFPYSWMSEHLKLISKIDLINKTNSTNKTDLTNKTDSAKVPGLKDNPIAKANQILLRKKRCLPSWSEISLLLLKKNKVVCNFIKCM